MIEVRRRSTASPGQVWAVLADGWRYAEWVVGTSRMRAVDPGWPAPGSRLYHSVGGWPLLVDDTTSVVRVEPQQRMLLQARGWPAGEARVEVSITPDGTGSLLTLAEDLTHGPGTLIPAPGRQLMIGPRNRESLYRLALLAEGGPA